MKIYKIGVIGLGDISSKYLNNLNEYKDYVQLYACACTSLEKAQLKAKEFGFQKAYGSGDELIADPEVDIVMNLTVPEMHYYYNIEAIKAGKHVYCEKPFAKTFAQAKEIVDLAKEKGLYCGSAPDTFMGGRIQAFKKAIDEGKLGEISGANAFMLCRGWEWFHPTPEFYYEPGGGPLLDMGPYYLTCLLSLFGPVDYVCAMGNIGDKTRTLQVGPRAGKVVEVSPEVVTNVISNIKFKNGVIANLSVSFDVWDSEMPRIEIYGTKGTLCMPEPDPCGGPNLFGGEAWFRNKETSRWLHEPRLQKDLESSWEKLEVKGPHDSVSQQKNSRGIGLVDMVQAIEEGRKNRASGEMAVHLLEIAEGILTSAKEKRFVYMETTFEKPEAFTDIRA